MILVEGCADVFGKELPPGEPVFFHQGANIAIFCWKKSKIKISGACESYSSDQTPMHVYTNIAYALNQKREQARHAKQIAPGLLITGAQQSGKSTLARILVNYALKLGWQPIYVDLDLNSEEISPPGCISASVISNPLPSDDVEQTVTFFHGSQQVITHAFLKTQIEELASAVQGKL